MISTGISLNFVYIFVEFNFIPLFSLLCLFSLTNDQPSPRTRLTGNRRKKKQFLRQSKSRNLLQLSGSTKCLTDDRESKHKKCKNCFANFIAPTIFLHIASVAYFAHFPSSLSLSRRSRPGSTKRQLKVAHANIGSFPSFLSHCV